MSYGTRQYNMTKKELAIYLRVHPHTIDKWRHLGKISFTQEGLYREYNLAAVLKELEETHKK